MTDLSWASQAASGRASRTDPPGQAPVIILTYAHAGAELLSSALAMSPSLTCTSATGLLPLCHEAISTWQRVEGRDVQLSSLAIKSVRALATPMISIIQARCGAPRWCEISYAPPAIAQTFLQVFPGTRFLCLHRSLREVLYEATYTYPWGLGSSPFWPYAAPHPGNNVATIAAYWAARTEALLDFEAKLSRSCLRVRYEDVAAGRGQRADQIFAFLGLDSGELASVGQPGASSAFESAGKPDTESAPSVPITQIPAQLIAGIRKLHAVLNYDSWPPGPTPGTKEPGLAS